MNPEWRDELRPHDALLVRKRFHDGAHDTRGTDAVTTHADRRTLPRLVRDRQSERFGKTLTKMEYVPDLDGLLFDKCASREAKRFKILVRKHLFVDGEFLRLIDVYSVFSRLRKGLELFRKRAEYAARSDRDIGSVSKPQAFEYFYIGAARLRIHILMFLLRARK